MNNQYKNLITILLAACFASCGPLIPDKSKHKLELDLDVEDVKELIDSSKADEPESDDEGVGASEPSKAPNYACAKSPLRGDWTSYDYKLHAGPFYLTIDSQCIMQAISCGAKYKIMTKGHKLNKLTGTFNIDVPAAATQSPLFETCLPEGKHLCTYGVVSEWKLILTCGSQSTETFYYE